MLGSTKTGLNVPPFVIDERLITSVYRKVSLEKKMRDRFDWTLYLDQRYRAIGYTFAWLELTERPDPSCIEAKEGYRVADILTRVRDIWPQGFADANIDELTGLLDEMVGLGVLLGITGRRYRLRSPNILRLLGGEENILAELERFAEKDFEQPYIPQVVRRILTKSDVAGVSSPLTLHQEGELLESTRGINLLLGSNATGLDRIPAILDKLFAERSAGGSIQHLRQSFTEGDRAEQLVSAIKAVYQKKAADSSLRFIVEPGNMSNEELFIGLAELATWLENLRSGQRFLRVICLFDPTRVLALRRERSGQQLAELPGVALMTLRRWTEAAQRHWFNDINRPPTDPEQPKRWIRRTGGWPMLMDLVQRDFLENPLSDPKIHCGHEELMKQTGLCIDSGLSSTFLILTHLGDNVHVRDLVEFAIEEGVVADQVRIYAEVLLDLELASGTSEGMRAEPFAAAALAGTSRG